MYPNQGGKMNERIKELAVQAGYKPLGTFADELMEIYNKKFAELIVRECIGIVGAGGEFTSRPKLVEKIQTHFGVE